jgi:hypothetical protein
MNRKPKIPLDLQTTSNTDMAKLTVSLLDMLRYSASKKQPKTFPGKQFINEAAL